MKKKYIEALTRAYTSVCGCGHAADMHGKDNGDSHAGNGSFGLCGCVLSVSQAALIAQAGTIAQQRQTIDALTAALEQIQHYYLDGENAVEDAADSIEAIYKIATDALEKRGESRNEKPISDYLSTAPQL